jgi:hypothetical protein
VSISRLSSQVNPTANSTLKKLQREQFFSSGRPAAIQIKNTKTGVNHNEETIIKNLIRGYSRLGFGGLQHNN